VAPRIPHQVPEVVGRDEKMARIRAAVEQGTSSSTALLLIGEPGAGKSALLRVATQAGREGGARVLCASGVEAESELAFAGLHQLLRPVFEHIDRLPQRHAAALRSVFGLGDAVAPDRLLIGIATLGLLAELTERQPVLVVVDDAPWIDRGSLEALAFAARRLQTEPVTVLVASRTEDAIAMFGPDMERMLLSPVDESSASQPPDESVPGWLESTAEPVRSRSEHAVAVSHCLSRSAAQAPAHLDLLKVVTDSPWSVDASEMSADLLTCTVHAMRAERDLCGLSGALAALGFACLWRGNWGEAHTHAEEVVDLATRAARPTIVGLGHALQALIAALRGGTEVATEQAAQAWGAVGSGVVGAMATWALGLSDLADGNYQSAFERLAPMLTPDGPAYHAEVCRWALGDVAEAAVHSGNQAAATADVWRLIRSNQPAASTRVTLVSRRAEALLASAPAADGLFLAALATDAAEEWPFELARTELCYGQWLRRQRRVIAARPVLRAALDRFTMLGAHVWADRARSELRAAGVRLGPPSRTPALDELTPQQLHIAQLAARGLTNREIGAQLYLSPRTVSFHLYNIFPKLHVTTRAQLASLLCGADSVSATPSLLHPVREAVPLRLVESARAWAAAT